MRCKGKPVTTIKQATSLVLILLLMISFTLSGISSADIGAGVKNREKVADDFKHSPDLRDQVLSMRASEIESDDVSQAREARVRVILQLKGKDRRQIDNLLNDQSIAAGDELQSLNTRVVDLPVKKLRR